jgi:hypothetical protein
MTIPDYPTLFWISAACSVLLIGVAKGGFGAGVGVLATPLMSLTIPVSDAVAILLPLLILCDIVAFATYRTTYDRPSIKVLLPGAMVGIAAGAFFFGYFMGKDHLLKAGIGVLAVLFVLFQATRAYLTGALQKHRPPVAEGVAMGALAGFTSTVAHAGGPPLAVYLLPQKLPQNLYVGTTAWFFAVTNAVKLAPYWYLGLLKSGDWTAVLLLAPLSFVGVKLGLFLNGRFKEKWFTRIVYTMLLLSGIHLIMGR